MRKTLLFLLIYLVFCLNIFSQDGLIKGTVKDEKGETLLGVSVQIKYSNRGTLTNNEGIFSIKAEPKDILVFSYIGYITYEIAIKDTKTLNVTLKDDATLLDEVVISGFGIETFRKDITGAVSKVDKSTFKNTAATTATELLQGRAAGVNIVSNDGTPGAGISINIRGSASISAGSSPLIVIDNVPFVSSTDDPTNPLANINPNDIESLDILKDASATALYGVGATNGVIVITTKRGKGKPSINFSVKSGIGTFSKLLPILSPQEYAIYKAGIARSAAGDNGGQSNYIQSPGLPGMWEILAGGVKVEGFENANLEEQLKNQYGVTNLSGNDWLSLITQNSRRSLYDFDFSGSTDNGTSYFASLGYAKEEGVLINSGFNRLSGRLNIDQKLSKYITVGLKIQYSGSNFDGLIGDNREDNAIAQAAFLNPFINRDNITGAAQGIINNGGQGVSPESPEFRLKQTESSRFLDALNGNINISIKPTSWLEFAVTGGIIKNNTGRDYFVSRVLREAASTNGRAIIESNRDIRFSIQPRITLNKSFNSHSFNLTLVQEARQQLNKSISTTYEQLSTEILKINSISSAASVFSRPSNYEITDLSYIGRLAYNYKSKYIVSGSTRIDQSSRFIGKKTGIFPALSVAWNASDEKFLEFTNKYLSTLKLRAGIGITGNNQIPINAGVQLGNISNVGYPFNNAVGTVVTPSSRFSNEDITWERTRGINFGIDLGFMNDRFILSSNIYHNLTKDLLIDVQLPAYSSFTSSIRNLGSLENKGLELEMTTRNFTSKKFSWTTNFNIAFNRNIILDLGGQPEIGYRKIGSGSSPNDVILRVGQSIGIYYGLIQDGLINNDFERFNSVPKTQDNLTGEFGFVDINGDGNIDRTEYAPMANTLPIHTGGIGNTVQWKNFDFYTFLRWTYGNDVINNNINRAMYLRGDNNIQKTILNDVWNRQQENNNYQGYSSIYTTRISSIISRSEQVEDGSFLRLDVLRIGYNLPSKLIKKLKLQKAKLTFTGNNLALISRYSWYDPEVNTTQGATKQLSPGIDQGAYPRSRLFLLGFDLGF